MSQSSFLPRALCSAVVLSLLALPAAASLGDNEASVQTDAQHLRASARVTQRASYSVHEMQSTAGTTVREYVSPQGKVFGVSWQGPVRPDLQQLLGSYYQRAVQIVQSGPLQRSGRHPISVSEPDLVVQMGGHPRAFSGRAYVPNLVPPDVTAQEIR